MSRRAIQVGDMRGVYKIIEIYPNIINYKKNRYKVKCTVCGKEKIGSHGLLQGIKIYSTCRCVRKKIDIKKATKFTSKLNICCDCKHMMSRTDEFPSMMCWKNYLAEQIVKPFMKSYSIECTSNYDTHNQ